MTTIPTPPTPNSRAALLRELAGVVLVLLGCGAVVGAAFAASTTLGVAVIGAVTIAAGAYLSLGKE